MLFKLASPRALGGESEGSKFFLVDLQHQETFAGVLEKLNGL